MFDLLIVDEAHHAKASSWERVISYFKSPRLGLTATPERGDGQDVGELFGEAAVHLSYEEAKAEKLIAEECYRVILTNSQVEGVVTRTMEYEPKALDRLVISENRNKIIVDSYLKYGRSFMDSEGLPRKAICFCITVAHAVRMRDLFREAGIKAETLVSRHTQLSQYGENPMKESERREAYDSFVRGDGAEILCVVNVLNEGKNVRDVGCLLMCRPTCSSTIFAQQMGRGCRRIEGVKERFLVLDFVDLMNEKHPPMTFSRLVGRHYDLNEIVTEYYKGKDPIVVDEYIHYLSRDYSFALKESKWSREKISASLLAYHRENGFLRSSDLVTEKTGLPNRTTILRYWKSVEACFKELRLEAPLKKQAWSKLEVEAALLRYKQKHGSIKVEDLGAKNRLPSKKSVEKYWGTWRRCTLELHLNEARWSDDKIVEALSNFHRKYMRRPKKGEFTSTYDLPSISMVKKRFGTVNEAIGRAL